MNPSKQHMNRNCLVKATYVDKMLFLQSLRQTVVMFTLAFRSLCNFFPLTPLFLCNIVTFAQVKITTKKENNNMNFQS